MYTLIIIIYYLLSVIKKPKLLLLKDALEEFDADEANKIIEFLIAPDKPWTLIVASRSLRWNNRCNKRATLKEGILTTKND